MSYPITYIYNNSGERAGYYTQNMCVADVKSDPAPKAAKPQPQAVAKATSQPDMNLLTAVQHFLFGAGVTGGAAGCNTATDGDTIEVVIPDGGVGPVEPDTSGDTVPDCPGCYETDGGIEPPQDDDGNPILFDAMFNIEINGDEVASNFNQPAPIVLEFPYLYGGNLQNKKLAIELTWVPGNIPEMPEGACHKGLLPVAELSAEAQALTDEEKEFYGITFCPEEGYQHLVACPHEEYQNQINTSLGGFDLLNGEFDGEEVVPNGENLAVTYVTPEEIDDDPESAEATEIPVNCGPDANVIQIPLTEEASTEDTAEDLAWWDDGNLWIRFNPMTLIGSASNFVATQVYKGHLSVKLVIVGDK
jgi:hypothetical protein